MQPLGAGDAALSLRSRVTLTAIPWRLLVVPSGQWAKTVSCAGEMVRPPLAGFSLSATWTRRHVAPVAAGSYLVTKRGTDNSREQNREAGGGGGH